MNIEKQVILVASRDDCSHNSGPSIKRGVSCTGHQILRKYVKARPTYLYICYPYADKTVSLYRDASHNIPLLLDMLLCIIMNRFGVISIQLWCFSHLSCTKYPVVFLI